MALDSKTIVPIVLGLSLCTASAVLLYFIFKKEDDEIRARDEIESSKHFKRDKSISKEIIPAIIGRGGSKVKEIEEISGARINLSKSANDENEKMLTLRGSQVALEIAEHLIDEIIELQKSYKTSTIKVPYWAVGKIIGKGGENITKISCSSGAKINVDSSQGSTSQRTITIIGTPVQIKMASDMIDLLVEEDRQRREADSKRREPRRKNTIKSEESTGTEHPGTKGSCPQNAPPAGSSGALLEVFVSAVSSPSRFWLQIFGPQVEQLDQLIQSMTEYYNNLDNRELHKLADIQVGQIVAAVFRHDGKWYRAKVAEIKPNEFDDTQEMCDLYFVDYGDNEYVAKKELFSLRTDMLQLRFQAVECFLAGVAPIGDPSKDGNDPHWNKSAIERFEALTDVARWKRLWSRTCTFKERPKADVAMIAGDSSARNSRESSPIPGVKLYDTKDGKDMNIGQILIDEGYAIEVHDEEKKPSKPSTPVAPPPANIRPPTFGDLECSRVLGMVVGNREERAASLPHGRVSPLPSPHPEKHTQDNAFFKDDDKLKSLSLATGMDRPSSSKSPSPKPSVDLAYSKEETNGIQHSNGTVSNGTKISHNGNDFLNAERMAHIEPTSESTPTVKPLPFHVPDPKDELKAKMNRVDSHHGSLEAMGKHTPPQCLVQKDNK